MSGGHWNYAGAIVRDGLETVSEDQDARDRWPLTAAAFKALAELVYRIEHEMDFALSGDSAIIDDGAFDRRDVGELLDGILKITPDAWFPCGKWATIQAIQGRTGYDTVRPE